MENKKEGGGQVVYPCILCEVWCDRVVNIPTPYMGSVHWEVAGLGFPAYLCTSDWIGLRTVDQDAQVSHICDMIGHSGINRILGTETVRQSLFVYLTVA